jgi:hypothetical protein
MVRRFAVGASLVLCLVAVFATNGSAAKSLKPPKVGTWKLIAAENTPGGVKVLGGTVGSFQVVGGTSIKNFRMTFVEEGESAGCAGGEGFESKGEGKKATIKFAPGASAPIIKTTSGYLVAVPSGNGVQGAEVPVKPPFGLDNSGLVFATLVPRNKKEPRRGSISWGDCTVAFIAKPK